MPRDVDFELERALDDYDDSFFGDHLEMEASSEDEEDCPDSHAKRMHVPVVPVWSDDSSHNSDEHIELDDLPNESFMSLPDMDDVADMKRGLVAASIWNWQKLGCPCKNTNCFAHLDPEKL